MSGTAFSNTASVSWFARHELTLAWRDWTALMSGGRRLTDHAVTIGMLVFAAGLHGIAYMMLGPYFQANASLDTIALITITTSIVLSLTMMMSQAMESVTRAFYTRDDLDLILSSPASSRNLFSVRLGSIALTTAMMSGLIVAPFVNVAALLGGAQWLSAYGVIIALACLATGCAVMLTLGLFRSIGANKTRLVAQIVAAVIGASFLIGIQVAAIMSTGSISRIELMNSDTVIAMAPALDSLFWLPAYAASGNFIALVMILITAVTFFAYVVSAASTRFHEHVIAAAGMSDSRLRQTPPTKRFQFMTPHRALLQKEWMLLARDPWLISQTLMQVLYLIPPALLLWVNFGDQTQLHAILAPVLVMAVGQLAGGLAWLTISGEDAPDLVATAPLSRRATTWIKVEAVLVVIAAIAAPMLAALALVSLWGAFATMSGILIAAVSAIMIQLWFRSQAKRSNFRRRQVASKAATFSEAFASILWAATTALAAAGTWLALVPAILASLVMLIAWLISPRGT